MPRSSAKDPSLTVGFLIGAWLQMLLGIALIVWGITRSAPIAGLLGAFAMLRGVVSVQRYRAEKHEMSKRMHIAKVTREFQ